MVGGRGLPIKLIERDPHRDRRPISELLAVRSDLANLFRTGHHWTPSGVAL
jgi:hypothetical protein